MMKHRDLLASMLMMVCAVKIKYSKEDSSNLNRHFHVDLARCIIFFTRLHVSQSADSSITVNQSQYVKDIHAISLSRERRCQPDQVVTEDERQALRALIGSLQYAAVNTRPDVCSRLGWLQSQISKAKVSTLVSQSHST